MVTIRVLQCLCVCVCVRMCCCASLWKVIVVVCVHVFAWMHCSGNANEIDVSGNVVGLWPHVTKCRNFFCWKYRFFSGHWTTSSRARVSLCVCAFAYVFMIMQICVFDQTQQWWTGKTLKCSVMWAAFVACVLFCVCDNLVPLCVSVSMCVRMSPTPKHFVEFVEAGAKLPLCSTVICLFTCVRVLCTFWTFAIVVKYIVVSAYAVFACARKKNRKEQIADAIMKSIDM